MLILYSFLQIPNTHISRQWMDQWNTMLLVEQHKSLVLCLCMSLFCLVIPNAMILVTITSYVNVKLSKGREAMHKHSITGSVWFGLWFLLSCYIFDYTFPRLCRHQTLTLNIGHDHVREGDENCTVFLGFFNSCHPCTRVQKSRCQSSVIKQASLRYGKKEVQTSSRWRN